MDLHERNPHGQQGISQGDTGMGVAGWVENNVIHLLIGGFVDGVNQNAFAVFLDMLQFMTAGAGKSCQVFHDLFQGPVTILSGFPAAQQVQVGAVQNKNACHRYLPWSEIGILPDITSLVHEIDANGCILSDFSIRYFNISRCSDSSAGSSAPSFAQRIMPCASTSTLK